MNTKENIEKYGFGNLFSLSSIKASKGLKYGYLNAIQYFVHHNTGKEYGIKNMCAFATHECSNWCFGGTGRLNMNPSINARINRSLLYQNNKEEYMEVLDKEVQYLKRKAVRKDMKLVLRMNGTSDKDFNKMGVYEKYGEVQFCEYTKNVNMVRKYVKGELPDNLHITLSRSELNHDFCIEMLNTKKINVAVPFFGNQPETFHGFPVITGDDHDLRFLDPKGGYVIALKFKGYANRLKASKERGFIIETSD